MANLEKRDRIETVQVGDPYTFLNMSKVSPETKVGGRLSAWWSTGEPGRLFEVTAVHYAPGGPDDYRPIVAVETIYVGFQYAPGAFMTEAEYLKEAEQF